MMSTVMCLCSSCHIVSFPDPPPDYLPQEAPQTTKGDRYKSLPSSVVSKKGQQMIVLGHMFTYLRHLEVIIMRHLLCSTFVTGSKQISSQNDRT